MKTLKQILEDYVPRHLTTLGGDDIEKELTDNEVETLRNLLLETIKGQTKRTTIYFIVFFSLLILAAIIAILANFRSDISTIANICTVTGVAPLTIYGIVIGWMRDRDNAKTLLNLLDGLEKKSLQSVVLIFFAMLKK